MARAGHGSQKDTLDLAIHSSCVKALHDGYGSQIVAKFKRENICQNQQLDT